MPTMVWEKFPAGCGNCGGILGIGGEPGCRCTTCGMCEEPTLTPVDGLCPSCAEESASGPFDGYDDEGWDEPELVAQSPGRKPRKVNDIELPGDTEGGDRG